MRKVNMYSTKVKKSALEAVQGVYVWVHSSNDGVNGECSNNGLSSYKTLLQIGCDIELVKGHRNTCIARPITDTPEGHTNWTFGGSYIATSDSRFSEAVEEITGQDFYGAIPLHDRTDTWEMHERLSR